MHASRLAKRAAIAILAAAALSLTACSGSPSSGSTDSGSGSAATGSSSFPVTITGALGTATITKKPERVATVNWENQEVPLALGIVPVGMAKANFGDDDGDGMLPWVKERLDKLHAKTPTLFDESDGIDFEAVADTKPDVILAAYSGLKKEDFDKLSKIAPVVAYPDTAWATTWRDSITIESKALGLADKGAALISDIDTKISTAVSKHPHLKGKSAMFLTHVDPSDTSKVSFYTPHDTRAAFFKDLGLSTPASIAKAAESNDKFVQTISAEKADTFDDVDIIVTYGDESLVKTLESDPVLSKMPAVANKAIVALPSDKPLGTGANPTPLAVTWVLDEYIDQLAKAADTGK